MNMVLLIAVSQLLVADASRTMALIRSSEHPPEGWVSVSPPESDDEWFCANYSEDLRVSPSGAVLEVSRFRETDTITLTVPGGRFVGVNRGEFGGTLDWRAAGTKKPQKVLDDNPVALLAAKPGLFVFVGLSHMMTDAGHVLRLDRRDARWKATEIVDLRSAPTAIHPLDDETTLVLTSTGVSKLNLRTAHKVDLFKNEKWRPFLYVNSVTPFQGSIFVGGRRAVIRLAPKEGLLSEEWWVPASCRRKIGKKCVCKS
jgi:hypothetical protein